MHEAEEVGVVAGDAAEVVSVSPPDENNCTLATPGPAWPWGSWTSLALGLLDGLTKNKQGRSR